MSNGPTREEFDKINPGAKRKFLDRFKEPETSGPRRQAEHDFERFDELPSLTANEEIVVGNLPVTFMGLMARQRKKDKAELARLTTIVEAHDEFVEKVALMLSAFEKLQELMDSEGDDGSAVVQFGVALFDWRLRLGM